MTVKRGWGRAPCIRAADRRRLCAGFLVAGFAPAYTAVSSGPRGTSTRSTETLVGVNGSGVVLILLSPLLATVVVAIALLWRAHPPAMALAWTCRALAAFTLLAMLTSHDACTWGMRRPTVNIASNVNAASVPVTVQASAIAGG